MNKSSNFISSYFNFWKRSLDIHGRSTRSEFWHPFWINFLITSLLGIFSVGTLSSIFATIKFEEFGLLGSTFIAGIFGVVIAGGVSLYILYLLIKPGNIKVNRYGSGGSCQDAKLLVGE